MKAITLNHFGATPVLSSEAPTPAPAAREVLVRVHAS
jgi:NADPH:quinone reductase-like Zn-dependent oxidoreductase